MVHISVMMLSKVFEYEVEVASQSRCYISNQHSSTSASGGAFSDWKV